MNTRGILLCLCVTVFLLSNQASKAQEMIHVGKRRFPYKHIFKNEDAESDAREWPSRVRGKEVPRYGENENPADVKKWLY
ncbi:hypothetical protein ACROYT_G025427 [Oculina patagonica]